MYTAVSTSDVKCLSPGRRPSIFSTRNCAACSKARLSHLMLIDILDHETSIKHHLHAAVDRYKKILVVAVLGGQHMHSDEAGGDSKMLLSGNRGETCDREMAPGVNQAGI